MSLKIRVQSEPVTAWGKNFKVFYNKRSTPQVSPLFLAVIVKFCV